MKTPIQELLEQIKEYQITNKHIPLAVQEQFLEKEKQCIIDAYFKGANDFADMPVDNDYSEAYYKETFNL